jgi:hypothetical protein
MTKLNDCSDKEVLNFLQLYFATVDLLTEAQEKYRRLAEVSSTTSVRSKYRALALESERDLELLKNQRRAFLANQLSIKPPSEATVEKTKLMADELAKILVKEANAAAIIELAIKGLDAFNQVTTA